MLWLYRIANRCFLDRLSKRAPIPREDIESFVAEEEADGPETRFTRHALVVQLLAKAPRDAREIVLHRYFDEMEHGEIAGLLGVNEKTVRRKLERFLESARKRVRS